MLTGVLVVMSVVLVGWGSYNSRIPNGNVYSCSTCHGSDYSLNSFGVDFQFEGAPDPGDPSDVTNPGEADDDESDVDETSWGRIKNEVP